MKKRFSLILKRMNDFVKKLFGHETQQDDSIIFSTKKKEMKKGGKDGCKSIKRKKESKKSDERV